MFNPFSKAARQERKLIREAADYKAFLAQVRSDVKHSNQESSLKVKGAYERLFSAAQYGRLNSQWTAVDFSPNQELYNDLAVLKVRSRDLFMNTPVLNNFVTLLQNNVVGDNGFALRSLVKNSKGQVNLKISRQIQEAWLDFCKKGVCETSGLMNLNGMLDLAVLSLAVDGEILMRKYPGKGKYFYQVQILHSEMLILTQHEEYLLGIKSDEFGKPLKYCITNRHPADGFIKYLFVPAEQVIHAFIPYQVLANRGVPMAFAVMPKIRELSQYEEAEVVAARIEASKFVQYTQEQPDDLDSETAAAGFLPPGQRRNCIEPGMGEVLPPGVKAEYVKAEHPTTQYPDFVRSHKKDISAGIGLSYNSLYSDFENTSFSSMRAAYVSDKAFFKKIQNLLVMSVLDPMYEDWIDCACASGVLDLPPVMGNYDFYKPHKFIGKAFEFSNPLQQATAAGVMLDKRLASRTMLCADMGYEYEDVCRDLQSEQETEKRYNINFEVLPKASTVVPVPEGIVLTPAVDPTPPPGGPGASTPSE
jgi:lambda family phage portal protein